MIDGEKILAFVPARGGSKGIKNKNLQKVKGRSLIEWTFLSAQKCSYVDAIVLSTDNSEIASKAQNIGYTVLLRPSYLATDESLTIHSVLYALEQEEISKNNYQWLLLLQATSPLRCTQDIYNAIEFCKTQQALSCVSVCSVRHHPHFMVSLQNSTLKPAFSQLEEKRRQDLSPLYVLNGAIYFANIQWLKKNKKFTDFQTQAYKMPFSRSLDIDTKEDLLLAEFLIGDK